MADEKYTPRLKELYVGTVRDELQKQFNYKNVMMIPKIEKIVVNMGVGEAATDEEGKALLDAFHFPFKAE